MLDGLSLVTGRTLITTGFLFPSMTTACLLSFSPFLLSFPSLLSFYHLSIVFANREWFGCPMLPDEISGVRRYTGLGQTGFLNTCSDERIDFSCTNPSLARAHSSKRPAHPQRREQKNIGGRPGWQKGSNNISRNPSSNSRTSIQTGSSCSPSRSNSSLGSDSDGS